MARLQRKKSARSKKKKKRSADVKVIAGAKDSPEVKEAVAKPSVARDVKKQQAFVPKRRPSASRSEPGKIRGYWNTSVQFLREVKVELKKVTWPSRKQTMGSTVVVLILVMIIAFFLGAADIGLSSLIRVVLQ